jgi:seryl-tRNA synthetase
MLDIDFIRDNRELVEVAIEKKHVDLDLDNLLAVDDKRRKLKTAVDKKRAKKNQLSGQIPQASDAKREKLIAASKEIKSELQTQESELKQTRKEWQNLMMQVPNIPDMTVPRGADESDNVEMKTWGTKPVFDFPAKSHRELLENLEMAEFTRGQKVHGFRGYYLKGLGAKLSWAIWNYARDFFLREEFTEFLPPAIVQKEYLFGTGHLPSEAEDLYETQDGDYLAGTAEIPMMAYHADEVLDKEDLPKKYLAFSPAYRREAGSHGQDTGGVFRVHEFYKLEQVILCEADHNTSVTHHERINENTANFLKSLKLPFQQVNICGGDLKKAQVKSYDLKLWIPTQERYREISSASYYHDYQTRRFNIKYKEDGEKRYVHSLNGTAIPTPRILVALLENNQNADGSVDIPERLQPYIGKEQIG